MTAIETIEIAIDQREHILAQEEGHFLDFKSKEISPAKLTQTLSAFANANGGELYVGIDSKKSGNKRIRSWHGFTDQESVNGHIQAFEEFLPPGGYYSYTFLRCKNSDGLLLKVDVNKTRGVTKASNGVAYLRRGAQNLPANTPEKFKRLELDKGISSYETETLNVECSLIENSSVLSEFMSAIVPSAAPESWLRKQRLIQEGKPTVASVLLFAELPQAILPKRCGIKILRYRTQDREGSRPVLASNPITIEGHLYKTIFDSVSETVKLVEDIPRLGNLGLEPVQYPPETLHEIITNAVLHRDYSIPADIQIRIFDNRIEVESPGRLPGHITTENILHEQFSRNGGIVRLIHKFPNPPNKDIGEGLNTAFSAMTRLKLKIPTILENENSVTVYIRHEPLASPEEAIVQYLETHYTVTNSGARKLTGITSENSMKQVFYRLRDKGLIARVPDKRGASSAWQKKGFIPRLF